MRKKKTLKELTIKDNFMFGAVMSDEENCRELLELILGVQIAKVEVSKEYNIVYHPEYKGVRLDVYAKDEKSTHYNVEMQAVSKVALGKRSRYYHSQMDMELLLSGKDYYELPDTYVIFICDFDPFKKKKYRYTFRQTCREIEGDNLKDGSTTIFLSTRGENRDEVSPELVQFLEFVKSDLTESEREFKGEYVQKLQRDIQRIKQNREMEKRYMLFELEMRRERREGKVEGKAESVLDLLQELGAVSEEVCEKIMNEKDGACLTRWLKLAAKAESVEQFLKEM